MLVLKSVRKKHETASLPVHREFRRGPVLIGRSRRCDLHIQEDCVSGHHAEVHWRGEKWEVMDYSSNGTWLNGEDLKNKGWKGPLKLGDVLCFGKPDPTISWQVAAPPTQPLAEAATSETRALESEERWPEIENVQLIELTAGPERAPGVELQTARNGRAVERYRPKPVQSILLASLASRSGQADPWINKRDLATNMGYGPGDEHRSVNRQIGQIEKALEKRLGLRDGSGLILSEKRGRDAFYRLANLVRVISAAESDEELEGR